MDNIAPSPASLKAILLTRGVSVSDSARQAMARDGWKTPRLVRSGMSGGLEFYLDTCGQQLAISCAVNDAPANPSGLVLDHDDGFVLRQVPGGLRLGQVFLLPKPSYYRLSTTSGKPMAGIAQQCFTRLAVGVFGTCSLNANPTTACGFCAIRESARDNNDCPLKHDEDILETVDAVLASELGAKIENVMLGGGTPAEPDRGVRRFAGLSKAILEEAPHWRITAMLAPPEDCGDLMLLKKAGVAEVSINLEFGSEEALRQYTPGKASVIGRERYLECLAAAVRVFGAPNVQSLLVVGLTMGGAAPSQADWERSAQDTLNGVNWLAQHKVVPVLSPFRPLKGTPLSHYPAPSPGFVLDLYNKARDIAMGHGMTLGPRCIPCQCNTMSLPSDVI